MIKNEKNLRKKEIIEKSMESMDFMMEKFLE